MRAAAFAVRKSFLASSTVVRLLLPLSNLITVDLSGLTVDKPVHVSDLVLPEGVTAVLKPEEDPTVASAVVVAEESTADEAPAVPADAVPATAEKSAEEGAEKA